MLDALEQALWARRPSGTVHHSDKGSQYVSLAYTQRLKEAGLLASTGSTGDSYDNATPEKIAAILPLQFFPQPADFTGPYVMLTSRRNNRALSGVMINADAGLAIRGIRHVAAGLDL